jgi:hypothetical protein
MVYWMVPQIKPSFFIDCTALTLSRLRLWFSGYDILTSKEPKSTTSFFRMSSSLPSHSSSVTSRLRKANDSSLSVSSLISIAGDRMVRLPNLSLTRIWLSGRLSNLHLMNAILCIRMVTILRPEPTGSRLSHAERNIVNSKFTDYVLSLRTDCSCKLTDRFRFLKARRYIRYYLSCSFLLITGVVFMIRWPIRKFYNTISFYFSGIDCCKRRVFFRALRALRGIKFIGKNYSSTFSRLRLSLSSSLFCGYVRIRKCRVPLDVLHLAMGV